MRCGIARNAATCARRWRRSRPRHRAADVSGAATGSMSSQAAALASRGSLLAFGSVSFAYFSYAGLFATYAPLWFQSLGFGTLAIGALISAQSATRLFSPYAWGWLADHSGKRVRPLRI